MLANLKAKVWMDDVTMTRLCCFLTHFDAEPQLESHSIFLPPAVPTQQVKVAKSRLPSPVMSCRIFFTFHSLQYLPPFSALQSHVYSSILPSVPDLFFEKTQHTLWVMSWFFWDLMIIIILYVLLLALISPSANSGKVLESPTRDIIPISFILPCIKSSLNPILILTILILKKGKKYCKFASGQKVTGDTLEKEEMNSAGTNLCRRSVICCQAGERWVVGGVRLSCNQSTHTHLLVCNMTNWKINF